MRVRAVVAVLLVLFLAACGGGGATTADDAATAGDAATVDEVRAAVEEGAPEESQGAALGGGEAAAGDGARAGEDTATGEEPAPEPLPDAPPVAPGDRIIKEGTVTLEVAEGEFDRAFQRVINAARHLGGDVVASTTRTNDAGDTFGSVTVRVPVDDFEDLVVGVGEVGTVQHRNIGSEDVTAEFTDLESRLRHLRAQERFYLGLLEEAQSVQDAIAVQQQVDNIQAQIEKAQGRINVLDDRTTFSTLTVELFEPNAGGAIVQEEGTEARPTLARYWQTARDAFVNVVGALLVAALFLLPFLGIAALGLVLWSATRRRGPTQARPASRADADETDEAEEPVGASS